MSTKKLIIPISALLLILLCMTLVGSGVKQQDSSATGSVEASSIVDSSNVKDAVLFLHNYETALKQAALETKPVLIFFSLPGSNSSRLMFETTFENEEIKRLSKQFVCIYANAVQDSQVCQRYGVESFPTILILSPQGGELHRLSGRQTTEQLSLQMHVVIQSMAAQSSSTVRK